MTTAPQIHLVLAVDNPPIVIAERNYLVPDNFWSQLREIWGYDGDPARRVRVPLSRFRGNLRWLKPACQRHGVGIDWDPEVVALVRQATEERQQLEKVVGDTGGLTADEVEQRLAGSRFRRSLKQFQLRDLGRLLALPNGANFSVPGAGKTAVAYATYEAERAANRVSQMLVVAPISAFDSWQTEAKECFDLKDIPVIETYSGDHLANPEVLVVNYHRLASRYDDIAKWVSRGPTLVLLDEAHRMKAGRGGAHGNACLDIAFSATRRDILTGTPAPQAPSDFVALLDFLWPDQARRLLPADALRSRPPDDAMHRVGDAIKPLFVRTRKQELGLGQPIMQLRHVPLDGLHRDIYMALRDRYAGQFGMTMTDRAELGRMGTITMYLLEAASNPHLLAAGSSDDDPLVFRHPPLPVEPGSRLWDLIQRYNQYETPPKIVEVMRMVRENAEADPPRKTLVWSNFVRNLRTMERMLEPYKPAIIYGGVPSELNRPLVERTRESELKRFREDSECMVLLANPAAMSEGISLHLDCHDAIYLDRTFNAGQYLQSIDRIHRLGLPEEVTTTLTFLVTANTIDEVVDDRIAIKARALSDMLDDPDLVTMALPDEDEDEYGAVLDEAGDVAAVLAHLGRAD